ncbi:MAG: arginase [Aggregatilineales bacterium]
MTPERIRIFGVLLDLGQKRRGVDMGPSAIRYAGLQRRLERLGFEVEDSGNIEVPIAEQIREQDNQQTNVRAYNAATIGRVCGEIREHMAAALTAGEKVIFLGGDHSLSIGTVAAALLHDERIGVLWIDAHGDFNTPLTTPSGNVHGMVVAALMGQVPAVINMGSRPLSPQQIAMIGVRDLDAEERVALLESGICIQTMRQVDENGIAGALREALQSLGDVSALHVSLDMDALDPQFAQGVGTPVQGGLTYREAHLLMELLADDGRVRSLDIVEINPILDSSNRTAELAVELVASLFGQRIL